MKITPDADAFVEEVLAEVERGARFREGSFRCVIESEFGTTVCRLYPAGTIEWYQYECWNRVKVGKGRMCKLLHILKFGK